MTHWEQGKGKLNGEILCRIADKYGTSTDYLLCRTDDPRPYPKHGENHYADKRQEAINAHFDTFNDEARDDVYKMVERMSHDPHARIEKDGAEHADDEKAVG